MAAGRSAWADRAFWARVPLLLLPCALLSILFASCGPGVRPDLTFANGVEPQTLDPAIITGQAEGRLANALFEGLMRFNRAGRAEPGVAERYELSPDGKTYTFYLRESAKWSDGQPVLAQDFYDSWRRVLTPATAAEYGYQLYYLINAKAYHEGKITDFNQVGVKVLGDRILEVKLENPTPFFLDLCAFVTLLPVRVADVERYGDNWIKPGKLVGNGAFELKSWRLNDRLRLERNPHYWDRENVKLANVDVLAVSNPTTAYNFYHSGIVDLIMDKSLVPQTLTSFLRKKPDFHTAPYLGDAFFRFNVTRPPFDDVRVRKAFCMVVDKQLIVDKITKSGELPARSFVPPGIEGYTPYEGLGYDPETARKLLAEAGYPKGANFPLVDYLYNESKLSEDIAIELKGMFQNELGVQITLKKQQWSVYLDSQSRLDFDLSRSNWVGDYADPNTFLDMFVTDGGNNRTGWSSAEYDGLIAAAAKEVDPAKRFEFFRQAEKLLVEEHVPICPLYFPVGIQIYNGDKIGGIEANVLDEHPLRAVYRK